MALAYLIPWLLLVLSSALTWQDLPRNAERPQGVHRSQADAVGLSLLGNFTQPDAFQISDPLPALAGCSGFDCVVRYCAFQDGAFSWGVTSAPQRGQTRGVGWTRYSLRLSSQAWMAKASNRAAWYHNLTVVVPQSLKAGSKQAGWATLIVNGEVTSVDEQVVEEMAARTGAIAAAVNNVPNAGLSFGVRGWEVLPEETLKAWSWTLYAHHAQHPEWAIEMPDAKAVVRAMDAVMAFTEQAGNLALMPKVGRFIVTGESKRGIATYMAGAVDPRVEAIVPLVISLNIETASAETLKNLGGFSPAAQPYLEEGATQLKDAEKERLDSVIDPLSYMDHLTMPKMIMNAGMDVFFPPDITRSWLRRLPGRKTFLLCGSCQHGGYYLPSNIAFLEAADSFINGLILGKAPPEIAYTFGSSGELRVQQVSNHTPTAVRLWSARTEDDKRRDFRTAVWASSDLSSVTGSGQREWLAKVAPEAGHWTAFFVEFEYPGPRLGGPPWHLSTEANVVPDTRPFMEAEPDDPKWQHLVLAENGRTYRMPLH